MRKHSNWLKALATYVEDTESPRHFWLWGGIFCLTSALQRKVWIPYGLETIYPNLYVMLVAPPGKCRKGSPVGFAKRILSDISIPVGVDCSSKRALTKEMHLLSSRQIFHWKGYARQHCSIALVSKELSTFLALDPKGLIEALTDLFDSHDIWDYKTSDKGSDNLRNICVNCFMATTPSWLAANLPEEAIGGGFTSRFVIANGEDKYKLVSIPPPPSKKLYDELKIDLGEISILKGEFEWSPEAKIAFHEWYHEIPGKVKAMRDDRLHGYLERIHIMVIKTAMALHVAEKEDLVLELNDISRAILLLEDILKNASKALGGHGRSQTSVDTERIMQQVRLLGEISFMELLRMNYRNTNRTELQTILETLEGMGVVKRIVDKRGQQTIKWINLKEER